MKQESRYNIRNYTKEILKATEYNGNSESRVKEISASMMSGDLQQSLLRYKYGVIKNNKIDQSEIGSLVHLGLENVFFGDKVRTEYAVSMDYKGWKLTGTIDRLDKDEKMITDIKVTKTYTIESILKDLMHPYRLQLNMYRILVENQRQEKYNMQLEVFDKQGGYNYRKGKEIPSLVYIPIEKIDDEIIFNRINEIIEFIEIGSEKRCDDVWYRRIGEQTIATRCELYCQYKYVCSKYNPKVSTTIKGWNL